MNEKILSFILIVILAAIGSPAQDQVDRIVDQIEQNNTTLRALYRQTEAAKIGTRIGTYPEDPEIELGFLRGSPSALGRRTDFGIRQMLDFPSAYFYRGRLAAENGRQLDREWQKQRRELLLEARTICLDLVYHNARRLELRKRLDHAQNVAAAFESKFSSGEANILELNKVKLNRLAVCKELEACEIEINALSGELARLNGGRSVDLADTAFSTDIVVEDFQLWYARAEKNSPQLQWLRGEVERLQTQLKLDRTLNLPRLSVGFMSESVAGERFSGLSAGLSLPLFSRRQTLRYAKASLDAARCLEEDGRLQFYNQLKNLHGQVVSMQKSVQDYRSLLRELDNSPLLAKAFEKGEISLVEYVLELSLYYESAEKLLQMERDLAKSLAVLEQYGK